MNDYMRLIAHAAAKFTSKPAVLSPLLYNISGWENKKTCFNSEPTKDDIRIILSVNGLNTMELAVEYDNGLKVLMQHESKILGDNNFKWSRDCSYEYAVTAELAPFLSVYWTFDNFVVIQARDIRNLYTESSSVNKLEKFKLLPIELLDILNPEVNLPVMKQLLQTVTKKSGSIISYVKQASDIPEANDILSLLTCIPLAADKFIELEKQFMLGKKETQSSQEESATEKESSTDSENQTPTTSAK